MAATFLLFSGAQTASAAGYGPGFDDAQNGGQGRIGAYSFEGRNVYCLQPWLPRPLDETTKGGVVDGQQFQMSDDSTARVNWAISTHGQSTDPAVTSAVAMFVWSLAAPESYASHGTSGDEHFLGRVPETRRAEVSGTLTTIREGAAKVGARAPASHSGSLQFTTDAVDGKKGTVVLASNLAGATGTAVLSGATFASTGTDTATLAVGEPASIVVTASALERGPVTVSGTAKVTSPSEQWAAKILLLHTPGAQLLGSSGGTVPGEFTAVGQDRVPRTPATTPTPTTTPTTSATPTAVPTPTRTAAPPRIPTPQPTQTASATPAPTPTATQPPAPTTEPPAAPTTVPAIPTATSAQTPPASSATPTTGASALPSTTATATATPLPVPPTATPANTAAATTPATAPATAPTTPQPETLAQTGAAVVNWPLLLGAGALVIGAGALAWGLLSRRRES
ncbi:hypothetical protein [Pseudoclavibacter sp. AY1F1]|uniref:hypothetical protein n=1 Tax=Pseudoclavibacter sp. AY1F1 TaxID=2080583 RepID=UPI0011AFE08F|nr:hypothetical protein [Pseudoclavibacter sp. AY1F1]